MLRPYSFPYDEFSKMLSAAEGITEDFTTIAGLPQ